jgi:hypothetical protein
VPFVHEITTAYLDVRVRPDTDAASNSAASNSFAKTFCEHHVARVKALRLTLTGKSSCLPYGRESLRKRPIT